MNCVHDLKEHGKDCEIRQSEREGIVKIIESLKRQDLDKTYRQVVINYHNLIKEICKRGEKA